MQGLKHLSEMSEDVPCLKKNEIKKFKEKIWKHGNGILKSKRLKKVPGGWESDEG